MGDQLSQLLAAESALNECCQNFFAWAPLRQRSYLTLVLGKAAVGEFAAQKIRETGLRGAV